jgi:hypothetical protein
MHGSKVMTIAVYISASDYEDGSMLSVLSKAINSFGAKPVYRLRVGHTQVGLTFNGRVGKL